MNPLRHLLLVAVLVFAQLAAGAHAVGHAAGDGDALPTHTCELCLTAHDLGAALPSLPLALPTALPPAACGSGHATPRTAVPPPLARQGAPPLS